MRAPSGKVSRARHIVCPFCEVGELVSLGQAFARCAACELPLVGSTLETLRDIIGLPDALGTHPCECGHSEMRVLPDGVYHCPACRSEVLPVRVPDVRRQVPDGRLHRTPSATPSPVEPT
jgi:hypothetical protein